MTALPLDVAHFAANFNRRDLDAIADFHAEDAVMPLMRNWDDFSAIASDFIVEGDRVVSLGAYAGTARATGKAMRSPFAHVWRVADDKLQRFDMYADTLLVQQALQP